MYTSRIGGELTHIRYDGDMIWQQEDLRLGRKSHELHIYDAMSSKYHAWTIIRIKYFEATKGTIRTNESNEDPGE